MAKPGIAVTHQATVMYGRPALSMLPQLGRGGWMPRPRNDSVDSSRIRAPSWAVATTTSGASTFGSTSRKASRSGPAPSARAASTDSCSRTSSTEPRTVRACTAQLRSARTPSRVATLAPSTAMNPIASSSEGNASWMSAARITSASATRPPKPARRPRPTPTPPPSSSPAPATETETRAP